jgi:hypothetical protein
MKQKSGTGKAPAEQVLKDIRRQTEVKDDVFQPCRPAPSKRNDVLSEPLREDPPAAPRTDRSDPMGLFLIFEARQPSGATIRRTGLAALGGGTKTVALQSEHDPRPEVVGLKGDAVEVLILQDAVKSDSQPQCLSGKNLNPMNHL